MTPASAWAMAPRISPCYVISRSISYAKTRVHNSGFTTSGSRLAGMRCTSLTSFLDMPFSTIALDHLFREHIAQITPPGVHTRVRTLMSAKPALSDRTQPALEAAARAYHLGFGTSPVFLRS